MGHNIRNNRSLLLNRKPAWHSLGVVLQDPVGAVEGSSYLETFSYDIRPVSLELNGKMQETKGDYGIVRSAVPSDPTERLMGFIKKNYKIVQPLSVCEQFDKNVAENVETMGFLGHGEKFFLTWKLPSFNVGGEDDTVDTYGFSAIGFDGKFGTALYVTSVRVVCQNTFNMAVGEGELQNGFESANGRGKVWSGRHNSVNLERDIGIWMEHIQQRAINQVNCASAIFNEMAKKTIENSNTLADLLFKIYPDPKPLGDIPDKLRAEKQKNVDKLAEKAERDRKMVESLFGGSGTQITPDGWGLFSSVTEFENYVRVERKPAKESIMFGNRAGTMARAANVIWDWAKKK